MSGAGKCEGEDEREGGLHGEVDGEEGGLEGGELRAREDAVGLDAGDEGLEDLGAEEGAVGEDVVGGWGGEVGEQGGHFGGLWLTLGKWAAIGVKWKRLRVRLLEVYDDGTEE